MENTQADPQAPPPTLALDPDLDAQVEAFARDEGIPFEEAHAALLRLGLDVARAQVLSRDDRLAALEARVHDLAEMLAVVGPAALGVRRLLAHWAADSGKAQVGEDELVAELDTVSADEWAAALTGRGVIPPLPPVEPGVEPGETQ